MIKLDLQKLFSQTHQQYTYLTKAASGATTGDWLVLFFTDECEACFKMTAVLDTVACKHRGNAANIANVARVRISRCREALSLRVILFLCGSISIPFYSSLSSSLLPSYLRQGSASAAHLDLMHDILHSLNATVAYATPSLLLFWNRYLLKKKLFLKMRSSVIISKCLCYS